MNTTQIIYCIENTSNLFREIYEESNKKDGWSLHWTLSLPWNQVTPLIKQRRSKSSVGFTGKNPLKFKSKNRGRLKERNLARNERENYEPLYL